MEGEQQREKEGKKEAERGKKSKTPHRKTISWTIFSFFSACDTQRPVVNQRVLPLRSWPLSRAGVWRRGGEVPLTTDPRSESPPQANLIIIMD